MARTEDFQRLCHDVAMHIAALDPRYVRREEVTQQILDHEREIYRDQARATGKPEPVIEKIVTGKMEKFYEENCLYEQHFIKDESVTVGELINQMIAKLGENISMRRFVRFKVGEGLGRDCGRRRGCRGIIPRLLVSPLGRQRGNYLDVLGVTPPSWRPSGGSKLALRSKLRHHRDVLLTSFSAKMPARFAVGLATAQR